MPCPECGAKDRLCVKNGHVYRKKAVSPDNKMGAKVNRYICTECAYTGRGNFFNLPEFDPDPEETAEGE